jgi:hypothetical protein
LQQWKKWPYTQLTDSACCKKWKGSLLRYHEKVSEQGSKDRWTNYTHAMNKPQMRHRKWTKGSLCKNLHKYCISFIRRNRREKGHMLACIHCCSDLTGKEVKETELETRHHNWR